MDRGQWFDELSITERNLGLSQGFKFLYCPWITRETARIAFLSLKPGIAPHGADLRVVSDERGNSYEVERHTTRSPITSQFLALAEMLGSPPAEILTGVATPFRAASWAELNPQQAETAISIGRRFWRKPLARSELELIVAVSAEAAEIAVELTSAKPELEMSAEWGELLLRRYRTPKGQVIVHLPHLSRFKLLSRPASRKAVAQILGLDELNDKLQDIRLLQGEESYKTKRSTETATNTRDAIRKLPRPVGEFFTALLSHPDFDCHALTMQMTVSFRGQKVGGLNRKISEWYFSKVFVANCNGNDTLGRCGFRYIVKSDTHQYWSKSGRESLGAFEFALSEMTEVSIR